MNEKTGRVFSIVHDNPPLPGCTLSKEVTAGVTYFSLAKHTSISTDIYPTGKLFVVSAGSLEIHISSQKRKILHEGEAIITEERQTIGLSTEESAVYTDIQIERKTPMNEMIQPGTVFKLADLLPYQEGKIVNMDVLHNDKMKFAVMSFAKNTSLSEHAAPGEALIFALDGEGIITYEGNEYPISKGENFHFAKGGMHAVKATTPFKMALLLTLE